MRHDKELAERGRKGEEQFREWLNQCGHAFVHGNQDKKMFASLFGKKIKRPDFPSELFCWLDTVRLGWRFGMGICQTTVLCTSGPSLSRTASAFRPSTVNGVDGKLFFQGVLLAPAG